MCYTNKSTPFYNKNRSKYSKDSFMKKGVCNVQL